MGTCNNLFEHNLLYNYLSSGEEKNNYTPRLCILRHCNFKRHFLLIKCQEV